MSLQGCNILISGAGRGIGSAIAELAASKAANLALLSRSTKELESIVEQIKQKYPQSKIIFESVDVRDESAACKFFEKADRALGGINSLVNNAAVFKSVSISETTADLLKESFETNLFSCFYFSRELLRRLIQRKKTGSIVNIGSLAGISGYQKFSGSAVYSATKYGLVGLTEVLAAEGHPHGIRANLVAPGATDTEMLRKAFPDFKPSLKSEDIAKAVCFYLDDEESVAISGTTLGIPG